MAKLRNKEVLNNQYEEICDHNEDKFWNISENYINEEGSKKKLILGKLEVELEEKNKLISKQKKQLEGALHALEEREKKSHEMEILLKTMEANLYQMENERKKFLGKIEEYARQVSNIQDRCAQYDEDQRNLSGQLKTRTHENILLNKESKDLQRINNQLRETITLLEDKNSALEQEVAFSEPAKIEMEKKYNRALESLRNEVKAKHQEILHLNREVSELNKGHQNLQRVNENLELELDMLNTTNISLQKKIEKLNMQNNIMEKKLKNKLVRFVLALCAFFGWNPEKKTKGLNC